MFFAATSGSCLASRSILGFQKGEYDQEMSHSQTIDKQYREEKTQNNLFCGRVP